LPKSWNKISSQVRLRGCFESAKHTTDQCAEWRIKYLDYKAGKKHVKAVARAVNRMNATPRSTGQGTPLPLAQDHTTYGAISTFPRRAKPSPRLRRLDEQNVEQSESLRDSPAPLGADSRPDSDASEEDQLGPLQKSPAIPIPGHKRSAEPANDMTIGSFVATPPTKPGSSLFELPAPALTPGDSIRAQSSGATQPRHTLPPAAQSSPSATRAVSSNAYEVGPTMTPSFRRGTFANLRNRFPTNPESPFLRRVLSMGTPLTPSESRRLDVDLIVVDQVRQRQKEFFAWMDKELDKIEAFYKMKEDEAGARLAVLREQLHEMRNRRIEEVAAIQHAKSIRKEDERNVFQFPSNGQPKKDDDHRPNSRDHLKAWFDPLERVIDQAKAKITGPHPGSNSKSLQNMQESPEMRAKTLAERNRRLDDGRDYVRKPHYNDEVPYRTAKRKLKLAMQEFYRGMELLKSYALLNRTAFRKINKKYDKAVNAHPPLRYMSEKVNKAWFVQSEVLDGHIHAVEDLYARYFERGNHKVATGKLRSSQGRRSDQSASAFRNGLLIGTGAVFTIQGIIYGVDLLHHPDPTVRMQTSYLLQIYGGYFLALYLFAWFCLDCSIWTRNKINYQFVFEFDPRSHLDWQELAEFPSFLILVFGLFIWLNFTRYGSPAMYIYYPVILIFATAVLIFIPAPILFHRSRRWFVYSHVSQSYLFNPSG
jgi:xenotropic and polytropic retrovirus receptor 1